MKTTEKDIYNTIEFLRERLDIKSRVFVGTQPTIGENSAFSAFVKEYNGYVVVFNNLSNVDPFLILHEMKHVSQMETGRLILNGDCVIWDGIEYDLSIKDIPSSPWEIDADKYANSILALA